MAEPTAQEQLFLELINRARLDPLSEAARYGVTDLNSGLSAGTLNANQKQVLTFNELLNNSADGHTAWMMSASKFQHESADGVTKGGARMAAAGYSFSGSPSGWGENLAWAGSTGAIDVNAYILKLHENLFKSAFHRAATLKDSFKEIGVGATVGSFKGFNNSVVVTQNFAVSGPNAFVTGVAYHDTNGDNFYSVGEGQGDITTELWHDSAVIESTDSWSSGGYSLETGSTGAMRITFSGVGLSATMGATFTLGTSNAKLDLVNGNTIQASVSATLTDASLNLTLLGITGTNGTGNELANIIQGNSGNNALQGRGGDDTLDGRKGGDTYLWQSGDGSDTINDTSTSLSETDVLRLTNVAWNGVALHRFGNDLKITITATGEILTVKNQFNASTLGDGIETLSFINGVNWNAAEIAENLTPPPPINGTDEADMLTGSADADRIFGFECDDILSGMAGGDMLDGGDGFDTASYTASGAAVTVNLSSSGVAAGGDAAGDTFAGIENITGSNFNDTLTGDAGNNRLDGGAGVDTMAGGAGDDTYVVSIATDKITELAGPESGTDTIETALATYSLAAFAAVENLTYTGTGNFSGTGNALANTIRGGDGFDTLNGGAGADILIGGEGNDTYVVDNPGDVVDEGTGNGTDLVQAAAGFDLAAVLGSVENLTLTGTAAVNGTGNGLANAIIGNSGANIIEGKGGADVLDGGAGLDTVSYASSGAGVTVTLAGATASILGGLGDAAGDSIKNFENILGSIHADTLTGDGLANVIDGGAGADAMAGGAGNDTYVVDNAGDTITESTTGGVDLVKSSIAYSLAGTNVENLTLLGFGHINATGNTLANILTGNGGNNRLDGGAGADTMVGGAGDDTYVVDVATDKVTETFNQGIDTVETSLATFSLAALTAVENLTYMGIASFTGTGNALANRITGGIGNDTLNGGLDADRLIGGAGHDTYVVDNTGDVVDEGGGSGTDLVQASASFNLSTALGDVENLTLTGSAAINGTGNGLGNSILGNGGANIIEGKGGADLLDGGAGLDTVSYASSGAGVTVVLNGAIATLGIGGDADGDSIKNFENITGSAHADTLTGNGSANVIDGGAGADAMNGGAGNDTYVVDNLLDVITEALAGGTDLVRASIDYSLFNTNLENLTLIGSDHIDATGNALANILTGNGGNNRLDGGAGTDTMIGGLGDDTYVVSVSNDKVTELAGQGSDTIETSLATYSLSALAAVENLTYTGTGNFIGTGNSLANRIAGGIGNDTLKGGAGGDTFVFNVAAFGDDKITDYQDNLDKLSFSPSVADSFDDFVITGNGTKSVTVTHGDDSIILISGTAFTLTADDFIFV